MPRRARRYWTAVPYEDFCERVIFEEGRTHYIMDGTEFEPDVDLQVVLNRLATVTRPEMQQVQPNSPDCVTVAERVRILNELGWFDEDLLTEYLGPLSVQSLEERLRDNRLLQEANSMSETRTGYLDRWELIQYVPSPSGMHATLISLQQGGHDGPIHFRVRVHRRFTY